MLEAAMIQTGLYAVNTYLIIDPVTGEAAVIDPGEYDCTLVAFLREYNVKELKYIFLTHGHFDHICGVYELRKAFGGKAYIHTEDSICLKDKRISLADAVEGYTQTETDPDGEFSDGDEFFLGENKIRVMHTPGHTRGSVIFISDEFIFSGDTLFRLSMGRTDLPGGSTKTLFSSLRAIGRLEGDYRIFPGHGEETSLAFEKTNNRYLRAK